MKRLVSAAVVALLIVTVSPATASTSTTTGLAPTDREYTRIVAGDGHTCVLLNDGTVKCWGDNTYGQLGVPTLSSSKVPVTVSSFGANRFAVELAAGKNHTCALLNDSSISCWGENNFGSLGNDSFVNPDTPVQVVIGTQVPRRIFAGGFTTCLIDVAGEVFCWGRNHAGQLGILEDATSSTLIQLDLAHNFEATSVTVGDSHVCAIGSDSVCWGDNTEGQLGDGTNQGGWPPKQTSSYGNHAKASAISAGYLHTCALLNLGVIKCWGNNGSGRLGDQTTIQRLTPVTVTTTELFTGLSIATTHSCGHTSSNQVLCWGSNSSGRLGNNSTLSSSVPVRAQLPEGATARQIAAGNSHTCALLDNDDVMCWGNNAMGKLGDGTTSQRLVPTKVLQLHSSPGNSANAALNISHNEAAIDTSFSTTGISSHRFLEYGTDEFLAGDTTTIDLGHFGAVRQIASGSHHSCMVLVGGFVKCWGNNDDGALGTGDTTSHVGPVDVHGLDGLVRRVAVGRSHSCAVISTGDLKCWGDNSSGQLGDGTVLSKTTPISSDVTGVVDVVLGDGFTCALKVGGTVACWGTNSLGQLGVAGGSVSTPTSVTVDGDHSVLSLSASATRVCAVLSNATVKCWGESITGIASPGTFATTVANVSIGDHHGCATLHNGNVQCWGDDSEGQLGDGVADSSGSLVTAALGVGDRAVAVSIAAGSSCALLSSGAMKCWGDGSVGVTGFVSTDDVHTPTLVSGIEKGTQMSLAELHGCALLQNGEVSCWGSNSRQQRGTGGNSITAPETMSSQIHATVLTELSGLTDDQSYFYRVNTTSTNGVSLGDISTFNTTELPTLPPNDDPPLDTPVDIPVDTPVDTPDDSTTLLLPDAPQSDTPGANQPLAAVESLKRRPSVKVGSLTSVRSLLRRLDFTVPKTTSSTKMWMTVLNKRVCRVYGARLWAIRKGTCQIMVLKMGPSRRLTMSRTQIKIVRSAR